MTDVAHDDNGNGKVTIAVLGAKLDHLIQQVGKIEEQVNHHNEVVDCRIRALEIGQSERQTQIKLMQEGCKKIEDRVDGVEKELDGLQASEKRTLGFSAIIAAILTTIGSIIATLFGK